MPSLLATILLDESSHTLPVVTIRMAAVVISVLLCANATAYVPPPEPAEE